MPIAGAAEKVPAKPPVEFLQTESLPWRSILATPITVDFHDATIREVIEYIKTKSQANINMVLSSEADSGLVAGELKITRKFVRVPLRTFFYQLSQDTGRKIDWLPDEEGHPRAIRIRSP